jgi:AraC-like DNA-binding protein
MCYQQAQQAALHRFFTGHGKIHYAENLFPHSSIHAFNYELTERIISAVRSFDNDDIALRIHEFITDISTETISQIICYILLLTSKLEELEMQNFIDIPAGWDYAFLYDLTLPIIENKLLERCTNDASQIYAAKSANSRNNALMKQVLEMVDEQIENPNLSVAYLADQVHLSVNYLRNLFKEATGDSLSSYITEKKLARICELLEDTDLSLNDISDRLGFTTKNYFFTFFKKHKGMTPGEYRAEAKSTAV